MPITKDNINTALPIINNSPEEIFLDDTPKKPIIKIHSSLADAEAYISRILIPIGKIEPVYYKDSSSNVLCVLAVGNIPGYKPSIFTCDSVISTEISDNITQLVVKLTSTIIVDKTSWSNDTSIIDNASININNIIDTSTNEVKKENIIINNIDDISAGGYIRFDKDSSGNITITEIDLNSDDTSDSWIEF